MVVRKTKIGDWIFDNFAQNFIKIYPAVNDYIAIPAAATITRELRIPFPHRWNSVHLRHTDSSDDDSNNDLDFTIRRPKTKNTPSQFEEDMFYENDITDPKISEPLGEKYEREASVYDIVFAGTNTDRIYPVFYIQKLGGIIGE